MVDTHCHLDHLEADPAEVVGRAREAGVSRLGAVGMNDASIEHAIAVAHAHEEVFAIVGRHPNEAAGFGPAELEVIERACEDPRVRAVGETGLDFYREGSPREDQIRAFEAHIDLAHRTGLPLVIHTRAAEEETFSRLRELADGLTVVLHCFSAPDYVDECVERGWLCSFAGNVTYPKATALQSAAGDLPHELLLVETDSPFLSPQPVRGRRNEPANVVMTAERLAEIRGTTYADLERVVDRNAARVLGW